MSELFGEGRERIGGPGPLSVVEIGRYRDRHKVPYWVESPPPNHNEKVVPSENGWQRSDRSDEERDESTGEDGFVAGGRPGRQDVQVSVSDMVDQGVDFSIPPTRFRPEH